MMATTNSRTTEIMLHKTAIGLTKKVGQYLCVFLACNMEPATLVRDLAGSQYRFDGESVDIVSDS